MARAKLKSTLGRAMAGLAPSAAPQAEAEASVDRVKHRELLAHMGRNTQTFSEMDVDPERCRLWPYHNRLYDLLDEDNCSDLLKSIGSPTGQTEAADGRRLKDDPDFDYEIVAGARRLWTTRYLKKPLRIRLRDGLDDEQAFLLSDATNTYEDISEFERAVDYKRALQAFYNNSQAQLAARLNIDASKLSRLMALAELEDVIVRAFGDPRVIRVSHAESLRKAARGAKQKAAMLAAAESMAKPAGTKTTPEEATAVTRQLIAAVSVPVNKPAAPRRTREFQAKVSGKTMLSAKVGPGGRLMLTLHPESGAPADEVLKAIRTFVKESYPKQPN